jgi:hypothetical protein
MRWPNLTRGMVDPTQEDTIDPCLGGVLLGVRLGQACAQLTHAWVKFSRVAQRRFLTAPSVCRRPNCPLTRRAKQRMGRIVHGSDCHSQRLDPLLRGQTERFGCGWTVWPLWGRIVSIWKRLWGESLQCRMVRVGVSQCPTGGWRNRQGTGLGPYFASLNNKFLAQDRRTDQKFA